MDGIQSSWVRSWAAIIRSLNACLDEIRKDQLEVAQILASKPPEGIIRWRHTAGSPNWARYYELSLRTHAVLAITAVGSTSAIECGLTAAGIRNRFSHHWLYTQVARASWRVLFIAPIPLAVSLDRTLESLLVNHESLNSLVTRVRHGDDESFFSAASIDPAVVLAAPLRQRLSLAVLGGEHAFLARLGSILKVPRKREHLREHARLSGALMLMAYAGQLSRLTQATAFELFAKQTNLYNWRGKDEPDRSLWRYIQRWKKEHASILS